MAFFSTLIHNIGEISKKALPRSPITNQEVGLTNLTYSTQQDPADREAIYPNWFFSSRLGQPRSVDTIKLRKLAQSPWAQMVIRTFKHQITTIKWEIVSEDEEDETDRTKDIKLCMDFFNKPNDNERSINPIHSELITDIAEIDASCLNYVYSSDSYTIGEVPEYNAWGQIIGSEIGLVLKPLGQRKLVKLKSVDGSTMLKQVDIHKNLLSYWQYSFKHPRQNPTRFERDEIEYCMLNPRSYDVYGFSPIQSIQQVIELLVQGTRYNKDLYTNNAIPDVLVSLPKLPTAELARLKRAWNNNYKGKPHQVGFINWMIDKIQKLNDNNRDLEWLEGQKWYFKIVFGVFGVSPEEAGFTESSNRATGDSQERVTVRNALKPYIQLIENIHTHKTISEILGREDHGLKFKFFPKDHTLEKIEFDQHMKEIEVGAITINEYRKIQGKDPVEWGDEAPNKPTDMMQDDPNNNDPNKDKPNPKKEKEDKGFKKDLEGFLSKEDSQNREFKNKFEGFLND